MRVSNDVAKGMYKNFGYSVYRQIVEYYAGGNAPHSPPDEDAYDMRKVTMATSSFQLRYLVNFTSFQFRYIFEFTSENKFVMLIICTLIFN